MNDTHRQILEAVKDKHISDGELTALCKSVDIKPVLKGGYAGAQGEILHRETASKLVWLIIDNLDKD